MSGNSSPPKCFMMAMRTGMKLFGQRREVLRMALNDPENYLRDEEGIISEHQDIEITKAAQGYAKESVGV